MKHPPCKWDYSSVFMWINKDIQRPVFYKFGLSLGKKTGNTHLTFLPKTPVRQIYSRKNETELTNMNPEPKLCHAILYSSDVLKRT